MDDINQHDLVKIVGPSKYGFNDRLGEVTTVERIILEGYVVRPKFRCPANLYPFSSLEKVKS